MAVVGAANSAVVAASHAGLQDGDILPAIPRAISRHLLHMISTAPAAAQRERMLAAMAAATAAATRNIDRARGCVLFDAERSPAFAWLNEFFSRPAVFAAVAKEVEAVHATAESHRDATKRRREDWAREGGEFEKAAPRIDGWTASWTREADSGQWLNYALLLSGTEFENNMRRLPILSEFLRKHKSHINVAGLSWLAAGASIPPHADATGFTFSSAAYHMPFVVADEAETPPEQRARISFHRSTGETETAVWRRGEPIALTGEVPHSAANPSAHARTILYLDLILTPHDLTTLIPAPTTTAPAAAPPDASQETLHDASPATLPAASPDASQAASPAAE
jgi:hypothetical protein